MLCTACHAARPPRAAKCFCTICSAVRPPDTALTSAAHSATEKHRPPKDPMTTRPRLVLIVETPCVKSQCVLLIHDEVLSSERPDHHIDPVAALDEAPLVG